jgi:hypothetical protein
MADAISSDWPIRPRGAVPKQSALLPEGKLAQELAKSGKAAQARKAYADWKEDARHRAIPPC